MQKNIDAVRRLFPHCVTEAKGKDGQIQPAIDFDLLRQELSDCLIEGPTERYQLNWPGKRAAIAAASEPIRKAFFPQPKESLHFQTTQNLFIEGDNLDALKLLQEIYLARVKAIYIDPPYNTGKDFLYKDKFAMSKKEWSEKTAERDEEGRLIANPDSGGRYHSNWLSMIYPRLKLARNLLSQDGVIFISIDDNEQHNLRKLCDEIFGSINFIAKISWQGMDTIKNDAKHFSSNTEFVFVYAREIDKVEIGGFPKTEKQRRTYKNYDNDPRGDYLLTPIHAKTGTEESNYEFTFPNGQKWKAPAGRHPSFSKENLQSLVDDDRILLDPEGKKTPQKKTYWNETSQTMRPTTFWPYKEYGSTRQANAEMRKLMGRGMFENPKPVRLVEHLLRLSTSAGKGGEEGDIVLDFFAGSCTTAHAVMKLNKEDGGNRRFIMVQLPEKCGEKTEAFKAGYKTIADIGKERIRRAAQQLGDTSGLRVLKIGDSNFKDCRLLPDEYKLENLMDLADNLLPNRKPLDLLFEAMWILGLDLHSPIQTQTIQNKQVFFVGDSHAIACFEEGLTEEFAKGLANYKPRRGVLLDGGFASDAVRINIEQLFQQLSPATHITIL